MQSQKPQFHAHLTPHRSLSQGGFIMLMIFIVISCVSSGLAFLVMGAWPITLFLALDVVLLWGAFKLNYFSGRQLEEVVIHDQELRVTKVSANGKTENHSFNPNWTKFVVDRTEDRGVTQMKLRQSNREIEIGKFLNPDDKESFASAFSNALATVR